MNHESIPLDRQVASSRAGMNHSPRHLIMGTAGHVDHGKTALIKALTGIDCDTHKEEKKRGITINLGFAHLEFTSDLSVGVVDVPGHKSFVHTMVGGASGMDFALLVVAADGGVMPQTREHLRIMEVLGVKSGLVAITRIDLTDRDIVDMAEEETRDLMRGTFLDGCPIVRVSSITGEGIPELKSAIQQVAEKVSNRSVGEVFRMFVDRIFTVKGFGTVVTGSVTSGELTKEDNVYLLPGKGKELRVRRLERHGREVERVVAGDRASVNLVGLDREDFKRGMVISDRILRSSRLVDCRLETFDQARSFALWSQVVFHLGTFENPARVHLIDKDRLAGGETALVQVHLAEPCVFQHGDRFVIRSSSSDYTLGGGEVIDAVPLHHRRRPEKLISSMKDVARGDLHLIVASEIRKRHAVMTHSSVADDLNVSPDDVLEMVGNDSSGAIVSYPADATTYLVVAEEDERMRGVVMKRLEGFHKRNPLLEGGRTAKELTGVLGLDQQSAAAGMLPLMLARMESEGLLKKVRHSWAIASHKAEVDAEMQKRVDVIEGYLKKCEMKVPLMSELTAIAARIRMEQDEMNQVLRYLVSSGRAYFFEGEYLHASVVDGCRSLLVDRLRDNKGGLTVGAFRDLVKGNRKICLVLLGVFDSEGTTKREGDLRILARRGA